MTSLASKTSQGTEPRLHLPCRLCGEGVQHTFVDLGVSPLCQSLVLPEQLDAMEPFYPLHALVCGRCFLVQLGEYVSPENIFSEYAYFSSFSTSWLAHAKAYCEMIQKRFGLGADSLAVELASNDGYLLQHFQPLGVPSLGIEPAANVAEAAREKGVDTVVDFFGVALAKQLVEEGKRADLIIGNNVMAQVPDLNDFVAGMPLLLKPEGVITLEFPHLERLMAENQFDTIYHEHFSYFSLIAIDHLAERHGLRVIDVEELPTHGGSLRVYLAHASSSHPTAARAGELLARERKLGFDDLDTYASFTRQVEQTKRRLLAFLIQAKDEGKTICGYGAPGKGNTLLNYCGIKPDMIEYTVDRNPHKQNNFLPGSRIPIFAPEKIAETRPDYILILPWNLKDEIIQQMDFVKDWGGQFVVPIPDVKILEN